MGEYDDMFYDPPTPRKQARLEATIETLREQLAEARSEIARLRAALEGLKRYDYATIKVMQDAAEAYTASGEDNYQGRWCHILAALSDHLIARAALGGEEGK